MLTLPVRLFACGVICTALISTVRAQTATHVEKLVVEQGDGTQDATLMPFEILQTTSIQKPTRERIYVTPDVFEKIRRELQINSKDLSAENVDPSFVVKEFNNSLVEKEVVVSVKTLGKMMRFVDEMFLGLRMSTPAWIHAIAYS